MKNGELKEKLSLCISRTKKKENNLSEIFDEKLITQEQSKDAVPAQKHIPKFYSKLPEEHDLIRKQFRDDARTVFLKRKSNELLENEELEAMWSALEKCQSPPFQKNEKMINYTDFKHASTLVNQKCRQFFKASTFSKFLHVGTPDPYGRIPIDQFINYAMKKVWLYQTRIGLSLYDSHGLGYLKETELENYILELIPSLPQLKDLDTSFYCFYLCTAVRKFFFFLDPLRQGRVKIQDVLTCSFLDDLLELKDTNLPVEQELNNWFSQGSVVEIYKQYILLDIDQNGVLSREEFSKFNGGTLTPAFLDRVFQECQTFGGEMDYKSYLDLVLATRHRSQPQSIQFFFKMLDIQHKGYLNAFDFHFFYKSLMTHSAAEEQIPFEDVCNEMFDMVKSRNPGKITCRDLIKSGHGDTIVGMLTDVVSFWTYENREANAQKIPEELSHA